jgi:hypothetical protein
MSSHISARRRVVVTTVVALAFGTGTASHAAARIATAGGDPHAVPAILPVPSAVERRAIRLAEAEKSDRWAYKLPPGARYSDVEMKLFAAEGI